MRFVQCVCPHRILSLSATILSLSWKAQSRRHFATSASCRASFSSWEMASYCFLSISISLLARSLSRVAESCCWRSSRAELITFNVRECRKNVGSKTKKLKTHFEGLCFIWLHIFSLLELFLLHHKYETCDIVDRPKTQRPCLFTALAQHHCQLQQPRAKKKKSSPAI